MRFDGGVTGAFTTAPVSLKIHHHCSPRRGRLGARLCVSTASYSSQKRATDCHIEGTIGRLVVGCANHHHARTQIGNKRKAKKKMPESGTPIAGDLYPTQFSASPLLTSHSSYSKHAEGPSHPEHGITHDVTRGEEPGERHDATHSSHEAMQNTFRAERRGRSTATAPVAATPKGEAKSASVAHNVIHASEKRGRNANAGERQTKQIVGFSG